MTEIFSAAEGCAVSDTPPPETETRILTSNTRLDSVESWIGENLSPEQIEARLLTHQVTNHKTSVPVFVPGVLEGDQRTNAAVQELHLAVLDSDKGDRSSNIAAAMKASGIGGVIYSTHSHGVTETEINVDAFHRRMGPDPITPESAATYLVDVKQLRPWVVDGATVEYRSDGTRGSVYIVHHARLEKFRVVVPLSKLFRRQDHREQFEGKWKTLLLGLAAKLGLRCDPSCTDVGRAYYYPSCRPGVEPIALRVEGAALDVDSIELVGPAPAAVTGKVAAFVLDGCNLKAWIARYSRTFLLAAALRSRAPANVFGPARAEGGIHITCPFEAEHTEAGSSTLQRTVVADFAFTAAIPAA